MCLPEPPDPLLPPHSANDIAEKAGHKTLTAADIIQALHEIEFPQFEEPVQEILEGVGRLDARSPRFLKCPRPPPHPLPLLIAAYKEIQRVKRSRKLAEKEAGKEGEKADESEPAESPGADNGAAAGGAAAAAAAADMQEDA